MQLQIRSLRLALVCLLVPFASSTTARAVPDLNVERVVLQAAACGSNDNCFNDTAALTSWIWGTRHPSKDAPLVVDIGPGEFSPFVCPSAATPNGYVTMRGSGRDRTVIRRIGISFDGAVQVNGCEKLGFEDLTVRADFIAVYWKGAGASTWTNVDIAGDHAGWYDDTCPDPQPGAAAPLGVHYFFGSRIESENIAFYGQCGESWFYGGEIVSRPRADSTYPSFKRIGVRVTYRGEVRLFGSSIRILAEPGNALDASPAVGVWVGAPSENSEAPGYGEFHMHGGIVSIDQRNLANGDVIGVRVDRQGGGDAIAHIVDTAWALTAGTDGNGHYGTAKRAEEVNGGHVHSPFLWPAGQEPPRTIHGDSESGLARSMTGYDMYVETDCAPNGDCDADGDETHLMIYDETKCGSAMPWFDSTARVCRKP